MSLFSTPHIVCYATQISSVRISDHEFIRLRARAPHLRPCVSQSMSLSSISDHEFLRLWAWANAPHLSPWISRGFELALLISGHDLMSICCISDHEHVLRISDHDSINICAALLTSKTLRFCPQLRPQGLRFSAQKHVLSISEYELEFHISDHHDNSVGIFSPSQAMRWCSAFLTMTPWAYAPHLKPFYSQAMSSRSAYQMIHFSENELALRIWDHECLGKWALYLRSWACARQTTSASISETHLSCIKGQQDCSTVVALLESADEIDWA